MSGYIDPDWPNPHGDNDARFIIYGYVPSFALCLLGVILFFILLVVHAGQLFRYRVWSFAPLAVGCLMEALGYTFRALSAKDDPYNIIWYVLEYFLIVTAPVFISASIYVCLSRLLKRADQISTIPLQNSRFLRPKFVLWTFITADAVSTVLQVAGAALIGSSESNRKSPATGSNMLLGGLAFQTFDFAIYLLLLAQFAYLMYGKHKVLMAELRPQRSFVIAVACASVLVFLRTIFRLTETAEGVFGYLMVHEAFFGALEFAPIVVAVSLLAVYHPGRCIGPGKIDIRNPENAT